MEGLTKSTRWAKRDISVYMHDACKTLKVPPVLVAICGCPSKQNSNAVYCGPGVTAHCGRGIHIGLPRSIVSGTAVDLKTAGIEPQSIGHKTYLHALIGHEVAHHAIHVLLGDKVAAHGQEFRAMCNRLAERYDWPRCPEYPDSKRWPSIYDLQCYGLLPRPPADLQVINADTGEALV